MAPTTCTSKWRCPRVRLAASRTLANASGRMSSSVSPSPSRRRNSLVFAASASSESSSTSGSNVLTMAAISSRRFSLRFSLICVIFPRTTKDAPYDGGLNESIIRATSFNTSARLRPSDRRDQNTAMRKPTDASPPNNAWTERDPNVAKMPAPAHRNACVAARRTVVRRTSRACSGAPRISTGSGMAGLLLDLEKLLADRVHDRLHPRVKLELLQDVSDVVLDGVLRDEQIFGDVPVVHPLGHQAEDLHLPIRQPRRGDVGPLLRPLAHRLELLEELRRHRRGDPGLARPHRSDGVGHFPGVDLFQQVSGSPCLDRVVEVRFLVADREHQDLGVREQIPDLLGGFDAGAPGHPDVHEHDIRHELLSPVHGFLAVGAFADDVDVRLLVEDQLKALPEQGVVVDDENPQALAGRTGGTALLRHRPPTGPGPGERSLLQLPPSRLILADSHRPLAGFGVDGARP